MNDDDSVRLVEKEENGKVILGFPTMKSLKIPPSSTSSGRRVAPVRQDLDEVVARLALKIRIWVTSSSRASCTLIEDSRGKHAFIGLEFNERNEAFDFNVALSYHGMNVRKQWLTEVHFLGILEHPNLVLLDEDVPKLFYFGLAREGPAAGRVKEKKNPEARRYYCIGMQWVYLKESRSAKLELPPDPFLVVVDHP
ncbi:uncharacterized protein HKW66_Vig0191130 [Vigna angularis]|uniref:NECAP PHear domain-containing protein n=1 Tax=Phaseolus angularis TaxID=3914 RepID=A0A8T0KNZ5_PHAAN|nr:uncharacterized protein HKW66_Vig0191130 [Vigna angularis]